MATDEEFSSNLIEVSNGLGASEKDDSCLYLLLYLKLSRGFDFSAYKQSSLMRRIHKRMSAISVLTYIDYVDYLEVHPKEFDILFNTILINVTSFFRDTKTWEAINLVILPRILAAHPDGGQIRIWSAGCASGEEAYSIVMLLAELIGPEAVRERVKVYATDADEEALQEARRAIYSPRAIASVPEEYLDKYFVKVGHDYQFDGDLRRTIIYGRHDLISDAPISRIDLLLCRNTLMYFNSEIQSRVMMRFHFALNPQAVLVLGRAEIFSTHFNIFGPLDLKNRIFVRADGQVILPKLSGPEKAEETPMNFAKSLLQNDRNWEAVFAVTSGAQMVIARDGTLALANNLARDYFRLTPSDIGRPFQDLEVSYRPVELRSRIDEIYENGKSFDIKDVPFSIPSKRSPDVSHLDVHISPVKSSYGEILATAVTFTDVTRFRQLQDDLTKVNRDLEMAYEELQSANEELETTNEELQSAIEELETTNEELHSTNEELETMNEEIQSSNEELFTANQELKLRSTELSTSNSFMSSIISSLDSAALLLNHEMQIQVLNAKAEQLFGLSSNDVLGAHFLSLETDLPVEQLKTPIKTALTGKSFSLEMGMPGENDEEKEILRVQLSALCDSDQRVKGVLLLVNPMTESTPGEQ